MATQIVIVHIGDIHIRDAHNPVLSRIDRELLSKRSDIIITGHEHLLDIFTEQSNSASPEYVAGRAMYDPRVADNGFNLITIDLTSKQRTVTSFLWRSRYYEPQAPETHAFLRNKAFAELGFQNNQAFLDRLSDIATGFTHARKALRLSDLFIYPNLAQRPQQRRLDGDQNLSPRRIRTRDIIGFILTTSRLFILGPQQSGRTSFAHMLYKLVQVEQKLIPLLIDGADLRSRDTVLSLLDTAFVDQYSKTALHSYKEAKAEQKCLIIDNLHRASISRTALAAVVRRLEGLFGKIVLFADERFDIDYVVSGSVQPVFYRYRQYLIEQLNRVQRATLIEKWLRLGRNDWDGNDTAYREVASKEATINTLLGRQLVPSYPIVIIALLQAMESASTPNMAHGSYGELYEALITTRFASVSRRSIELGIKYAITSRLAYWLFTNETDSFTVADANLVCDQYHLGIGLRLAASEVIAELIDAGVIKETAGNYRFSYPYYFHYFVARYLRDRRRDGESDPLVGAEVRKQVAFMADRVYFEEYSNILVFYLYLTKDICLIDHILTNAQQFFSDCAPCSLEADIEEINNLSLAQPLQAVLPCDDVNKNRYDLRERLDEIEESATTEEASGQRLVYSDDLDDLIKLNIAFKTIHILGQVLRNFPGDINRIYKKRIAEQCYLLGLRIMSFAMRAISVNADTLRRHFVALLTEKRVEGTATLLGDLATKALLEVAILWVFGIVKTLSQAVGMEELSETYAAHAAPHDPCPCKRQSNRIYVCAARTGERSDAARRSVHARGLGCFPQFEVKMQSMNWQYHEPETSRDPHGPAPSGSRK